MVIPGNEEQQMCGGTIDQARAAEESLGGTIMEIMKRATLKVLSTLVVKEKRIVEKGPITLLAHM